MLTSIAWVKVRNMWKEMEERLKLGMLSEIAAIECESKLCSCGKEEGCICIIRNMHQVFHLKYSKC